MKSIVIVAPLAGLLGTVAGMIETFDALGDGALFAASGGVAGGISQALLTTQMGLVVAIPGVIMGRILDRKQFTLEEDLDQMVILLSGEGVPQHDGPTQRQMEEAGVDIPLIDMVFILLIFFMVTNLCQGCPGRIDRPSAANSNPASTRPFGSLSINEAKSMSPAAGTTMVTSSTVRKCSRW